MEGNKTFWALTYKTKVHGKWIENCKIFTDFNDARIHDEWLSCIIGKKEYKKIGLYSSEIYSDNNESFLVSTRSPVI